MNSELSVLVTTSIVLTIVTVILYIKRSKFKLAAYAYSLYTFSSYMSITYYFQPLAKLNGNITWPPMLYWIVIFAITLIPLYWFDKSNITGFKYDIKTLDKIALFGFIVSIWPFFEQLLMIPSLLGGFGSDLGEIMVDLHDEGNIENMTFVGRNLLRINIAIYDLSFIILLIQFIENKKSQKTLFFILIIILTRNLTGLISGHRSAAIEVVMKLILIVLIASPLIKKEQQKVLKKYVVIVFSFIGILFLIITLGRQMQYSTAHGDDFTLFYFLSWYAGEGLVNFNQYLTLMKETMGGEYTSSIFLKILGQNPHIIDREYLYGHMTYFQGIPQNIFYTFIGNFVMDYGFKWAALVLILLSLLFRNAIIQKTKIMPISNLFLLIFYSSIIIQGVTSFCYNGEHGKFIIWSLFIYIYLRIKKM